MPSPSPACAEPDEIAGGDDAAFVGQHGLEQTADGAAILPAVLRLNDALQAENLDDPAALALIGARRRHFRRLASPAAAPIRLVLNDGAMAREVALGADALVVGGRFFLKAVLLKAARPLLRPRRLRAVSCASRREFFSSSPFIKRISCSPIVGKSADRNRADRES